MMTAADSTFLHWAQSELVWLPRHGMGHYPVTEQPYDERYFRKYERLSRTELGQRLIRTRIELVDRFHPGRLVDVGIGSGAFIEARGPERTTGFDISETALAWLRQRGLLTPMHDVMVEAVSCWDSLEHIPEPARLLANVTGWVFCCLPIFDGPEHVLRSKHFKPAEHCWYWTRDGLIGWMRVQGFECLEHSTVETLAGREDIHTFVFRRS